MQQASLFEDQSIKTIPPRTITPTWQSYPPSVLAWLQTATPRQLCWFFLNLETSALEKIDRAVTNELFSRYRPTKKQRRRFHKPKPTGDVVEHQRYYEKQRKKYHTACFEILPEKDDIHYWKRPRYAKDCQDETCAFCGKPLQGAG